MSVPQIPQCVMRISMSVAVKGLGVKVVYCRALVASKATQPSKVLAGGAGAAVGILAGFGIGVLGLEGSDRVGFSWCLWLFGKFQCLWVLWREPRSRE